MPNYAGLTVVVDWDASKVQKGIADLQALFSKGGGLSGVGVDSSGVLRGLNTSKTAIQELKAELKLAKDALQSFLATGGSAASAQGQQLAAAYNQVNNQLRQVNANTKGVEDAYSRLSRITNEATRWAQNLGVQFGTNSQQFTVAANRAKQLTEKLKEVDAATGRNFRNVGNYASGYNAISVNMARIVGEMPNFTQSMKIGFMAISNNIQPLAESIQQLNVKNKELAAQGMATVSPLKALGSALFSWNTLLMVGVAALTAYGPKLVEWITGTEGAAEAQKRLNEEKKELQRIDEQNNKAAGNQIAKIKSLVAVIESETSSHNDKLGALKKLKDMYPTTLGNISLHDAMTGKLSQTINRELIPAILAQARAMSYLDKVSGKTGDNINLEDAQRGLFREKAILEKELSDLKRGIISERWKAQYNSMGLYGGVTGVQAKINESLSNTTKAIEANTSAYQKNNNQITGWLNEATKIQTKTKGLDDGFQETSRHLGKAGSKAKEAKTDFEKYTDATVELNQGLELISRRLEGGFIEPMDAAKEKLQLLTKAQEDFYVKFNQPLDSPAMKKLSEEISIYSGLVAALKNKFVSVIQETQRAANEEWNKMPLIDTTKAKSDAKKMMDHIALYNQALQEGVKYITVRGVKIPLSIELDDATIERGIDQVKAQLERFSDIITSAAGEAAVALTEGIGNALSGVGNVGDIFKGIGSVIANAMVTFGKEMIKAAIAIKLAKEGIKAFLSNTPLAIAAGAGLIIVGTAMKNALQKKAEKQFAFADGGIVYGPTNALVGEYQGAANNPEVIAPLNKLKDLIGGGQTIHVSGDFKLSKGELVMAIDNAYKWKNR